MSVIPQTPRASWALYQGSALDPLGTLSGPQPPSPTHAPLTTNPGSAPDNRTCNWLKCKNNPLLYKNKYYLYKFKSIHFRLYVQLFIGVIMSYLRYLCLFALSGVKHILWCVFVLFVFVLFLVYTVLPVSLDYPFLIAPSVFPMRYFTNNSLNEYKGQ